MKYATRHTTTVLLSTLLFCYGGVLANAENVIDDSENPGYLFVLSATSGSLKGDTLTLNGVPNVIYFSDRPTRKAGHISLEKFVQSWNKGSDNFKEDPPNATLSILEKDEAKNVVVELYSVEYKNGSLHFKVVDLEGNITGSFEASSLFIDTHYGIGY